MSAKDVSDELVKEAWPIAGRCVERPYNHGTMTKAALVIAKVLAERDARNERLRLALLDAEAFVQKHYAPAIDSEHDLAVRIRAALSEDAQ